MKRRSAFFLSACFVWGLFSVQCVDPSVNEAPDALIEPSDVMSDVLFFPFEEPPDCNPLAPAVDCLLPFPNDVFRIQVDGQSGAFLVRVPDDALVSMEGQGPIDLPGAYPSDGFPVDSPILVLLGEDMDDDGLVFHSPSPEDSLLPTSRTVLLDGETGEPVLHFAELDMRPEAADNRVMSIRPMERLKDARRYVVGVHGVLNQGGEPIAAPDGFRKIRDGESDGDEVLSALASRYEEGVFGLLESHGVERESLQLAWEFTTRSEASAIGDMLTVFEDAMGRINEAPPSVTIDTVEESFESGPGHFQEYVARVIRGHLRVPLYLDSTETDAHLFRDEAGSITENGFAEVPFTVLIPKSVIASASAESPAPVLQYGHGFFGSKSEAEGESVVVLAERLGAIVIATDWWGLAKDDMAVIVGKLAVDTADVMAFTDRLHQAMVNYMALAHACGTSFMDLEAFQENGVPLTDGSEVFFYGNSVGHIMGGTYVALSPHVERAVFGVGGASIPLMMSRSTNFAGFVLAFQLFLEDPVDVVKLVTMFASSINRIDPITYAPYFFETPFPWAPEERRVLMQVGMADTQVPNLSSHYHARALGLSQLEPAPRDVFGLTPVEVGSEGKDISAMIEVDFQIEPDPIFLSVLPNNNTCVHEAVRVMSSMQDQIVAFLGESQRVIHPCEGPCEEACDD